MSDAGGTLADLFTADGVLQMNREGEIHRTRPTDGAGSRKPNKGPGTIRHFFWNMKFGPSADGATGKTYVVVARPEESGQPATVLVSWAVLGRLRQDPQWMAHQETGFHAAPGPAAAAVAPQPVPRPADAPTRLSADDYAEIHQLYARYPYAFDGGTNEGKDYADLFTADGTFVNAIGDQFVKGLILLAAFARGALRNQPPFLSVDPAPATTKNPLTVNHMLTNIMLTPTSEVPHPGKCSSAGRSEASHRAGAGRSPTPAVQ